MGTDIPGCGTPLCHAFPDSPIPTVLRGCVLRRPARSHLPLSVPGTACPGRESCWPPASTTSGQIRSGANEQPPPGAKDGKPAAWGQAGKALLAVGSGLVLLPQDPWGGWGVMQPPGAAGTPHNSTLQEDKTWGCPCCDRSGHPPPHTPSSASGTAAPWGYLLLAPSPHSHRPCSGPAGR